jgi:hypothetical protein
MEEILLKCFVRVGALWNVTAKATCRQLFDSFDNLKACNHSAILYEESEHARMVEYQFIQTGLQKSEYCIHTTPPTKTILASSKTRWLILE